MIILLIIFVIIVVFFFFYYKKNSKEEIQEGFTGEEEFPNQMLFNAIIPPDCEKSTSKKTS